ncbi:MAG: hypothetical protein IJH78_04045 [Clostridia bacterium]|nr:hypothetical protein [Clostridia bacterium]
MGTHTYQTKKCPHCGRVYSHRSVYGPDAREKLLVFGPLFVKCPACGQMFRDSDAVELAVMEPPKFYLEKIHLGTILLSVPFAVIGLVILIKGKEAAANPGAAFLLCAAFVAGLLLTDYSRYRRNMQTIERERMNSIDRLKRDPAYALALKQAGYNVPEEYLPKSDTPRPGTDGYFKENRI